MKSREIQIVQGSQEYLYADVRADRVLDEQPVQIIISAVDSPVGGVAAEWVGVPSKVRSARILLDGTLVPDLYYVYVKITDSPEVPIIFVGYLRVV